MNAAATTTTLPPDPATLSARQLLFMQYLVAGFPTLASGPLPGLQVEAAAAAAGNSTQESDCQSVDPSSEGSDGSMQWLGVRLTNMKAWCTANFGGWQSLEPQAAFFIYECSTQYPTVWGYITTGVATRSIATLTADVCDYYEIPSAAYADLNNRIAYANDCYNLIQTASPPAAPSPTPAPAPAPVTTPTPAPTPTPTGPANAVIVAQIQDAIAVANSFIGILNALLKALQG
jgi:Phage tail lysozyme